jgi:hypothetical protein
MAAWKLLAVRRAWSSSARTARGGHLGRVAARRQLHEHVRRPEAQSPVGAPHLFVVARAHVFFGDVHAATGALVEHLQAQQLAAQVVAVLRGREALLAHGIPELGLAQVVLAAHVGDGALHVLGGDAQAHAGGRLADELLVDQPVEDLGVEPLAQGHALGLAVGRHDLRDEGRRAAPHLTEPDGLVVDHRRHLLDDVGFGRAAQRGPPRGRPAAAP